MKLFVRILIGTSLCFVFSYFCSAIGKLGSFEAVAARYAKDADNVADITVEKIFPANQIQEIEINSIGSDISFQTVDTEEVKVVLKGQYAVKNQPEQALGTSLENGKLTLTIDKSNQDSLPHMGLTVRLDGKLLVSLPRSIKKISVKTVSGELEAKDISLNSFDVETVSGDIKGTNSQIEKFKLDTTSGKLVWQGQLTELKSESISGDMELELKNSDPKIEADSVSGDLKFTFDSKPNLKMSLETTSGDLDIAPSLGKVIGEKNDFSVTMGAGKGSVNAKTVSGDLTVVTK